MQSSPDNTPSTNDPGDDVIARFEYQHKYAVVLSLQLLYKDSELVAVYCELHDDVLIRKKNGKFVSAQIKTRDTDQPFKANDEQIVGALTKFIYLETTFPGHFEQYQLCVNAPFYKAKSGTSLTHLKELHDSTPEPCTSNAALERFRKQLKDCPKKEFCEVLKKLVLVSNLPRLQDIDRCVKDHILQVPEIGDLRDSELFEVSKRLIDQTRSAATRKHERHTYLVLTGDNDAQVKEMIASKTISAEQISRAIDECLLPQNLLVDSAAVPPQASDTKILLCKVKRGQIASHNIELAQDHRNSAERLYLSWASRYNKTRADSQYEHVANIVRTECIEAYDECDSSEPFGQAMLENVRARLKTRLTDPAIQKFGASYEHLLGIAWLLTQDCTVWWSNKFPLEECE